MSRCEAARSRAATAVRVRQDAAGGAQGHLEDAAGFVLDIGVDDETCQGATLALISDLSARCMLTWFS